ncbi:MAG: acetyl-CoA hydrolase/transferase C-terminal domain-containing protein [Lachnospiraceae bacterium]
MDRIPASLQEKIISPLQAAEMVSAGNIVAFSGFGQVGDPHIIPKAIVELGKADNLTVITGASVGPVVDGDMIAAGLVSRRFPYQTGKIIRQAINDGNVAYADQHLSHTGKFLMTGDGPGIDIAIVECCAITEEGLYPATVVGTTDSCVACAKKVLVELNTTLPVELVGMHDIYSAAGKNEPIALSNVMDRLGTPFIPCAPEKIAGIVVTDDPDFFPTFRDADEDSKIIASNIVDFLKNEIAAGRQPECLNPIQSGVGNVANAVLAGLGNSGLSGLSMFTEVLQDSALDLIKKGIIVGASCTSMTLSRKGMDELISNMDYYNKRIIIRPQEISNNPELVRRLRPITLNTPIEVDIYGNVNSTHVMGTNIMNGIGGSGDFTRNGGLTIFATPSLVKGGAISCIVPMCSHIDHTEHDVMVIVTEQGVADLRWKSPRERAVEIIENCAHPEYKDMLRDYFNRACEGKGHTPHILSEALSWHDRFNNTGSMKL